MASWAWQKTIHRDYPDYRAKDVRNSILWPALPIYVDFTYKYKIIQGVMVGWSQSQGRSPSTQNFYGPTFLWPSFFCRSNIFRSQNFFGPNFLGPNIFELKIFLNLNVLGLNYFRPKIFWTQHFFGLNVLAPTCFD